VLALEVAAGSVLALELVAGSVAVPELTGVPGRGCFQSQAA
jgi:hypothetical protein